MSLVGHLQPSLIFASKAGAYLIDSPFMSLTQVRLLALPTNFRLGWKGLTGINTLAYSKHL